MASKEDLVVTADESEAKAKEENTYNPLSGAGGFENVYGTAQAIENGDWDSAGLNAMGAGVDAVGLAVDPLGNLASWGVGWMIDNVGFLRDAFDDLAGNPDAISGMADTWENVAKELKKTSEDYARSVEGTTEWEGKAGDAYRKIGADCAKALDATATASGGMKEAVQGAQVVVSAVRGIIRDIIATAVGEIISIVLKWGIAAVCTAGIAAGGAIAEAVTTAVQYAQKISGWMKKLGEVLHNLWKVIDKLGPAAKSVRETIDKFFAGLAQAPAGHLGKSTQKQITQETVEAAATKGVQNAGQRAAQNAAQDAAGDAGQRTAQNAAEQAAEPGRLRKAWEGAKAGGSEFTPFQKGDIFKPSVEVGPDKGTIKTGYELTKEYAKLDDGDKSTKSSEEQ